MGVRKSYRFFFSHIQDIRRIQYEIKVYEIHHIFQEHIQDIRMFLTNLGRNYSRQPTCV